MIFVHTENWCKTVVLKLLNGLKSKDAEKEWIHLEKKIDIAFIKRFANFLWSKTKWTG